MMNGRGDPSRLSKTTSFRLAGRPYYDRKRKIPNLLVRDWLYKIQSQAVTGFQNAREAAVLAA